MRLFIVLVTLVLAISDIFPKYGKIVVSSFLGKAGISGLWINVWLRNFWMHVSINLCTYTFFDNIFLCLWTSWLIFKKSEDKKKQRFNNLGTTPNLCSSLTKLMKLVRNLLSVSFLKTLVLNLSFSRNILTSRKKSYLFIISSNSMFVCFVINIFKKTLHISWLKKTKTSSK